MNITGTHIAYLHTCHRKIWLFAKNIQMEQTSELVSEGKLIDETTYPQRSERYTQIELEGIKIDYFDNKTNTIHETKKSDKIESAHEAQVKYYIWRLEQEGLTGVKGVIEYPKLRHITPVEIKDSDRINIPKQILEIQNIISLENCPDVINSPICKKCAYYEFCYINE